MGLNQFLYVTGLQYTSPTNACVIGTSTPIVALLLSALFLHMRITARRAVGIVLACCGALVLLLGSVHGGGGHLWGTLCGWFAVAIESASQCLTVVGGREPLGRNARSLQGCGEVIKGLLIAFIGQLPGAEMAGDGQLGL